MKFGMEVVVVGNTQNLTFLFPNIGNNKMAEEETCEVGSTLAPLAVGVK
jgi:hypothetical protein